MKFRNTNHMHSPQRNTNQNDFSLKNQQQNQVPLEDLENVPSKMKKDIHVRNYPSPMGRDGCAHEYFLNECHSL